MSAIGMKMLLIDAREPGETITVAFQITNGMPRHLRRHLAHCKELGRTVFHNVSLDCVEDSEGFLGEVDDEDSFEDDRVCQAAEAYLDEMIKTRSAHISLSGTRFDFVVSLMG